MTTGTTEFFDALETRDPAQREAEQLAALPALIAHAQRHTGAFALTLAEVDAASVDSRAALARLPVIRKHALLERQQAQRAAGGDPFGGFSAIGWRALGHAAPAPRRGASTSRPVRSTSPKAWPATTGASAVPCSRPACAPATWCTTAFPITSHPAA